MLADGIGAAAKKGLRHVPAGSSGIWLHDSPVCAEGQRSTRAGASSLRGRDGWRSRLSPSNGRHYQPLAAASTLSTGRAFAELQVAREADAHLPQSPTIAV